MESLEEWRIKEKVQQSANSHSLTPTATCTAAHSVHSLLSPSILSFTAARPSCVAVSGESADLRDVDVLVRCIGSGLLQSAGVAALFSTGCWWGLSRVRGMTSFRKVVLSGGNTNCQQHNTQHHTTLLARPVTHTHCELSCVVLQ